ncbi:UDP-N-acetylglucosamine 4,6-dehydratase (inverting) [Neisseriaceae bacterium TC5R-5]|nr:UDP-N-acetylglucosamine 4,6-dehydratase (inverting) [Neisseriaceae bacterium TC5R-5]
MANGNYIKNKTILVTGGTGSFGQAFVAKLLNEYAPRELIIFSRDEFKQSEMAKRWPSDKYPIRYFLGDIRDSERLRRAFIGVDVVVHAAALKQVPALENNPMEAVKTNIMGAQNILEAALERGVKRVVGISTDKAVSPTNLYGATKLAMEKLLIAANNYSRYRDIKFSVVRYGNVLGSRGSVIPFWCELYKNKNFELPLTDERMTRFLIDLSQGVDLVVKAIEEAGAGEIFIPKIPSATMLDLIKAFPGKVSYKVTGIRPGEKLHEALISEDEGRHTWDMGSHYVVVPEFDLNNDARSAIKHGEKMVAGFSYTSENNHSWLSQDELQKIIYSYL